MTNRYDQLIQLIHLFKPRSIIEVGTWNGNNAIRMIKAAQQHHAQVTYTGYDLFEEATAEIDKAEFNVKHHNAKDAVLAHIVGNTHDAVRLIKGNTRETLKRDSADLVFIDGGHSLETIRCDYAALAHNKIIVLDDYYSDGPALSLYGCNDTLMDVRHVLLPQRDPVSGGGFTQFALVVG